MAESITRELQAQLAAIDDISIPMCIVCKDRQRTHVLLPCGHVLKCEKCSSYGMDRCSRCGCVTTAQVKLLWE